MRESNHGNKWTLRPGLSNEDGARLDCGTLFENTDSQKAGEIHPLNRSRYNALPIRRKGKTLALANMDGKGLSRQVKKIGGEGSAFKSLDEGMMVNSVDAYYASAVSLPKSINAPTHASDRVSSFQPVRDFKNKRVLSDQLKSIEVSQRPASTAYGTSLRIRKKHR